MSINNNKWLEKYEIKHPDLLYIREGKEPEIKQQDSIRYKKRESWWVQKHPTKKGLFGRTKATLMFTGDLTCFDKQFESAETETGYDFDFELENMKPVFSQADLVVGNLETGIVPAAPYRSEKVVIEENFYCNAPVSFLSAIRNSGIDMLTTANNHDIDVGTVGLGETIDNINAYGFIHTGTFKDDRRRYEIIDVNGIKVAIIAFATDHNALSCNLTEEGHDFLLNHYKRKRAKDLIDDARNNGADIVIVCMHWGKENKTEVHKDQYRIAKDLARNGCDCIIGSHPHVLQKFEYVESGDRKIPVYYSLGNFVSQNYNNIKARSAVACLELIKRGKQIQINCSYIPVYTCESFKGRKIVVLPIKRNVTSRKAYRTLQKIKNEIGEIIKPNHKINIESCVEDKIKREKKKKQQEIDISKIEKFPFKYNDTHFNYEIQKEYIIFEGVDPEYRSISCTVPEEIQGVPVSEMVEYAFRGNDHLKKVKAVGFKKLERGMFKDCKLLEGFRMSPDTEIIGEEAFSGCENLQSAIMKRGVKRIEKHAFQNCKNLMSVKLPDAVEYIADDAFDGCNETTFYCNKGSYAEKYAKEHNIKVVNMNVY